MKYLYKRSGLREDVQIPDHFEPEIFTPTIWGGLFLQEEQKSFKLLAVRLLFQIMTFGRARVYCWRHKGELAHTSYVVPKCWKFPFMKKHDFEIGPCLTYSDFRGRGLYPQMLKYIVSSVGTEKSVFYMIVDENNAASIKGIEKAGFQRCGSVRITKALKRYRVE